MNNIGLRLRQTIENQCGTINNFANKAGLEKGQIYLDLTREDVNTKRLRLYLPALGLTFSEFFKDFEKNAPIDLGNFEKNEIKKVGKSNNDIQLQNTINHYERILEEKERILQEKERLLQEKERNIEVQQTLIEVLQSK